MKEKPPPVKLNYHSLDPQGTEPQGATGKQMLVVLGSLVLGLVILYLAMLWWFNTYGS